MKVMITGAGGQLGKDLITIFEKDYAIEAFDKENLDITDEKNVFNVISNLKPDLIINAAAYTAVDDCEINRKLAYEVNSFGAYYVAKAAKANGASMVQISTDYIFNGKKDTPYEVDDSPDPISIYGQSKMLGEQLVRFAMENSYIVRTSWLYGHHGKNFVKTMLHLGKMEKSINVVDDQIGSPTFTYDLATAIKELIGKPYGIYHITNQGSCSWFNFAKAIFQLANYDPSLVQPLSSEQYKALAQRPAFSVLSSKSIESVGVTVRHWEEALQEFIEKEVSEDD